MRLYEYASRQKILSDFIVTYVGSLTRAKLRMAGAKDIRDIEGPLEITSLVGTFGTDGSHFHVSVSDENGTVIGGHLMEESIVHTTAEVVIGKIPGERFNRKQCEKSGWKELSIEAVSPVEKLSEWRSS